MAGIFVNAQCTLYTATLRHEYYNNMWFGFHQKVTPDTDSILGGIREVVRAMIVVSLT